MPAVRVVLRCVLSLALLVASVLVSAARVSATPPATPSVPPAPTASGLASGLPVPSPSNTAEAKAKAAAAAARVAQATADVKAQIALVQLASQTAAKTQAAYQAELITQAKAQQAAVVALIHAAEADAQYASAEAALRTVITQQYINGGGSVTDTAHLLVATNPSALLSVLATQQQIGDYQDVIVSRAQQTRQASIAAHNAANMALLAVQAATAQAKQLRDSAANQLITAHEELLTLRAELTKAKTTQAEANAVLSLFLGGWVLADPARAAALNEQYMKLAAQVVGRKMAPANGKWSPLVGESVVWRTIQEIGLPYAWAGGGIAGPSRGVCASGDAHLDCLKIGFDCSGLTMYGWGPYLSMPHYAATQYTYGHFHPTPTQLQMGDLLFWSTNNTVAGIHHVAMYVGDGNVIQAPNSGDIVRITPLGDVDSGYFGATRPLT